MDDGLARLRQLQDQEDNSSAGPTAGNASSDFGGMVAVSVRDVVGEKKKSPMISYYAAGVGVMFLLFTASAAGGSLLDESDSGALDRVLSRARHHDHAAPRQAHLVRAACLLPSSPSCSCGRRSSFTLTSSRTSRDSIVMTAITSFAVASFGMLLASLARTRGQLAAFSTLIILTMSALGGSMFPKFIMSDTMIRVGYFTFNSWAISGYQKIFWRDEPIRNLGPEAAVLVSSGIVLFLLARWFARKWEYT